MLGALAVFWCHIESADTRKREQESDTPVLKRTDGSCGARRQHFISFRWGNCKKNPITLQLHSQTDGANVFSPCRVAGVSTCGALFTPVPGCSGYRAHAVAALTSPTTAAESAILWRARLGAGAAVAIVPFPAALAMTLAAVTHSVTYGKRVTKMRA